MRISIALCTYNGARYIEEQLESLFAQEQLPDELVICDDASQDRTVDLVRAAAERAPFPATIEVNPSNLGVTRNFERAIGLCSGEIIFLCDQDDVWRPDKIRHMMRLFAATPDIGLVFTNADVVDQDLKPTNTRLWDHIDFDDGLRARFAADDGFGALLTDHNVVTGATAAIRRSIAEAARPFPDLPIILHDAWLALIAAGLSRAAYLDEPSILYRQHAGSQVGVRRIAPNFGRDHYRTHLLLVEALRARLAGAGAPADRIALIDGQIAHLRRRLDLPADRFQRVLPVARELATGRYTRFSSGVRSAIKDILAAPGSDR